MLTTLYVINQSIVDKISEKLSQRRAGEGENAITGRILGMQELQELGKENMVGDSIWKQERPKRDDLFCIMVSPWKPWHEMSREGRADRLTLPADRRILLVVHIGIDWSAQGSIVDPSQHHLFT